MNVNAVSPQGRKARIPITRPAVLFPDDEAQQIVGKTHNLSEGGVFVGGLDHRPEPGARVRLSFALPNGVTIESDATVLRSVPSEHPCETSGVALRFDQLEDGCSEALHSFIKDTLLKPADEEVKVKLATPKMVITTKARSLQDNLMILEQELPFLRLGSKVQLLRASEMKSQAGALRWVSMHVPPTGDFPRITIGVDLEADAKGEARKVAQPPPLPPDVANRSDPTIDLEEQPELISFEESSTGSTIDLDEEPGLIEEIKRPRSDASLYDLDFLDLVGRRTWLNRLVCAFLVMLVPGIFAFIGYGLSKWMLKEPKSELATSTRAAISAASPLLEVEEHSASAPAEPQSFAPEHIAPSATPPERVIRIYPASAPRGRAQAKSTARAKKKETARPAPKAKPASKSHRKQAKPTRKGLKKRSKPTRRQRLAAARRAKKAKAKKAKAKKKAKKVQRHLRLAKKALKRGKWRLARKHAIRARRLDPKNKQARRIIRKAKRRRRT